MEIVLVGCGTVAERYVADLPAFPALDLVAVADRDADRAADLAARHDCGAYGDAETMLAAVDPDLAVNLTSHGAHAGVTRTCLDAGVSVYSEKPLAMDADGARALVDRAEERGLALGCAPRNHRCEHQRVAAERIADGSLGRVGVARATANVGRPTEWHDRPESFLAAGPLYDGAVYPLTPLVEWFGPVERVRSADATTRYPARAGGAGGDGNESRNGNGNRDESRNGNGNRDESRNGNGDGDGTPAGDRPTHVEATLDLAGGPLVSLTASMYVPHRTSEFVSLELHGDDGSLSLEDAGDLGGGPHDRHLVRFGRAGRGYTPVPRPHPPRRTPYLAGPAALARAIARGQAPTGSARRGAHLVSVCEAIERAAADGGPVAVDDCGFVGSPILAPRVTPDREWGGAGVAAGEAPGVNKTGPDTGAGSGDDDRDPLAPPRGALRLPPVGFGCSQYRDGEYVDRRDSIETALDAGYRLLDSAELYGNERRIGEILAAPGSPTREAVFVASKVWNTNHGHVREACETTLSELGIGTLDAYLLHWPDAWEYTGPLRDLASVPVEKREELTFPEDVDGERRTADVTLEEAWRGLEAVHADGLARTLGVCNVDRETVERVLGFAEVPPAVVQVERHPYQPRAELVEFCHERGIRVVAHSPLSAPGLLDEPVLADIAAAHDATPAGVVLAWNVQRGVVPIPASTDPDHIVENAAAAGLELTADERARIDALADPGFER